MRKFIFNSAIFISSGVLLVAALINMAQVPVFNMIVFNSNSKIPVMTICILALILYITSWFKVYNCNYITDVNISTDSKKFYFWILTFLAHMLMFATIFTFASRFDHYSTSNYEPMGVTNFAWRSIRIMSNYCFAIALISFIKSAILSVKKTNK